MKWLGFFGASTMTSFTVEWDTSEIRIFSAPDGVTLWEVGEDTDLPDELVSEWRYFVIADGGTGTGNGAGTSCGLRMDLRQRCYSTHYSIYLPNGGHTTQELTVTTYAVGESVA